MAKFIIVNIVRHYKVSGIDKFEEELWRINSDEIAYYYFGDTYSDKSRCHLSLRNGIILNLKESPEEIDRLIAEAQ